MRNILLAAKYLALQEKSNSITLKHLMAAIENVQIANVGVAKIIESSLGSLSIGSKSEINQQNLEEAGSMPKVDFSDEVKELLTKLENDGYSRDRSISKLNAAVSPLSSFEKIKKIKAALQEEAFGQVNAVETIS